MVTEIQVGERVIGQGHPPFIIAEMSGNHNQSLERALQIVDEAALAGVDALKLQTYTPETMTLNLEEREFVIQDPNSLWAKQSLYGLYKKAYTPWEWHAPIFQRCKEKGLLAFSSAFDETSVDFLESMDVPLYKIASFENNDIPLLRRIAATGKPVILSTGMATLAELDEAVRTLREGGCQHVILLKCTSSYPAPPEESHIHTIPHMSALLSCQVGLSDHTPGIGVAVASVAIGATVIEKHFTLSRSDGGVDAAFSLEPAEMASLVQESRRAWKSLGQIHYGPSLGEMSSLSYRRSLYITKDLEVGEYLTRENVKSIRPGYGLPPKYLMQILGRRINKKVVKGTPLSWDLLRF